MTSQIFIRLAAQGKVAVQAYLGFLFETGRGVPQTEPRCGIAAPRRRASAWAQYSCGLLSQPTIKTIQDTAAAKSACELTPSGHLSVHFV